MSTIELSYQISALQPVVRTFTRRFTSDPDEALDLVQDTILRALIYKDKFKEHTNLKGWLFTIMRNTFINNYRKEHKARIATNRNNDFHFLNVADTHTFNGPATNFEYNEIWTQVSTLQDELLIPFKMHASGYKYQEIAERLGIPLGTVKNRIFQARKEIQQKLAAC